MTQIARDSRGYEDNCNDLLAAAQVAARGGDAPEMLRSLFTTPVVDGLARRLAARWPRTPRSVIDTAVGAAIDTLFEEIRDGGRVRSVIAFLWKVAECRIHDFRRSTGASEAILSPEEIAAIARPEPDDHVHGLRPAAIEIARRLLPRLGQGQIIAVMTFVIDAVAAERHDLPAEEIADALGISASAARSLMSRGFQRLERLARAEGLQVPHLPMLADEVQRQEQDDAAEEED